MEAFFDKMCKEYNIVLSDIPEADQEKLKRYFKFFVEIVELI